MATYPNGNPGVFPVDPNTAVGKFRLLYGDIISVIYSPNQPGFQNYTNFSDAEITAMLAVAGDSTARAIGYAYLQSAGTAAVEAKSITDYDLKVDTTKRGEDLRKVAQMWFDLADEQDGNAGTDEYFDIIETIDPYEHPEGTAFPYGGMGWL